MKRDEILDKQISGIDDNIKTLEEKNYTHILGIILAMLGIIPAGIFAHIFTLYSGIAMLTIWETLTVLHGYIDTEERNQDISLLEYEKKHLENIKENGIKSTKKMNTKRLERIRELTKEQNNCMKKDKTDGTISQVSLSIGLISSMLLAGTGFAAIGVVSGLFSFLVSTVSRRENSEKMKKLEARIYNLKNDIELGSIDRYDSENTVVDETKEILNKGESVRTISYLPIQESQVDQYLVLLENLKTNDSIKQKVKK